MSRKSATTAAPVTIAPYRMGAFHAFRVFDSRTRRACYFDTEAAAIAYAHTLA